jgi:hypothetical protein
MHAVYRAIINAIQAGKLNEPFTSRDFKESCPGLGKGTYNTFLHRHCVGNSDGSSELFIKVAPGKFNCARPFKYGL